MLVILSGRTQPTSRLLTVEDVAKLLAVSERHVRYLAASKQIRSIKVGKGFRFRESWVNDFIEGDNDGRHDVDHDSGERGE